MRKFLLIFIAIFLFVIMMPTLANADKSEVNPREFSEWTINGIILGDSGETYVWLENPNKDVKINRAILKTVKGFIAEYIYWNENDTSFYMVHRFKYNMRKDRYDDVSDGDKRKLIK